MLPSDDEVHFLQQQQMMMITDWLRAVVDIVGPKLYIYYFRAADLGVCNDVEKKANVVNNR